MDQMERAGSDKWVAMEKEAPCFPWVAWKTWISPSRKASLETEFTACMIQAIIFRHFLQQSLETFRTACSSSHRGAGAGPTLGGCLADARASICSHSLLTENCCVLFIFLYLALPIHHCHLLQIILLVWLSLSSLPISSLVGYQTLNNKPTLHGLQAGIAAARPARSSLSPSTSCENLNPKNKSLPFKPFGFPAC